ncbi:hypothetical protein BN8_02741 [Fibrisoma limi BUZ 3]|uniref:PD-(D/E)XK endonuclease-like domain-containing protein n=2 Tax=Fibrisoma limi TaxID=663275 RepID=I2GIA6_9BACT|nr:hypothetical protein BN8_02741 [Fibrisoma limi BUZ 3]
MDDVWVILPTRRAVSVFLEYLANESETPFLAPHTLAVDDFITRAAGVQLIDSVSLIFELYDVFRVIDPQVEFEQFIGWASVLLADFERIDQYLINTSHLFEYLTAAKAIERWNLELPSGAKPLTQTPGTSRYFRLFENLQTAYHALHTRLNDQGLAYRGMAYRLLAENVETLIRDNTAYEKVYFVGFNALSRAEEHMIRVLVDAQKAELFWDVDTYYMDNTAQEAGDFLRKYRDNGWFFTKADRERQENNLAGTPKNIRVVGVANASMQAKVAGKIYKEWEAARGAGRGAWGADESPSAPGSTPQALKTAIVLADESLLVPVLYALDESVTDLNVTMGLSLRSSLLFTLIDTLFEMQRTVHEFRDRDGQERRIPKFHHRHVVKVLNHPFIKQYERIRELMTPEETASNGETRPPEPLFQWISKTIVKEQRVYLTEKEIRALGNDDPLIRVLFSRWPNEEPLRAIQALYDLIELLRDVYRTSQDAIEIEYLYLFFSLLKQLETTLDTVQQTNRNGGEGSPPVTVRSFRQFLYELIRQTSIPFTSEGNSRLQVMGMLETRALDFERVIILSVNEGILPQSRRLNSLIPFDISLEMGLPTYREQEAVMAYHFYRLLQRAEEVVLLHTTSPDAYGNSKGEPSRFIRQIEYELVPKARGLIRLSRPTVRFGPAGSEQIADVSELHVPKTDGILTDLRKLLTDPKRGIYPSYVNQFVSCSMRFYFSRIVGISEEDDIEEKMGAIDFGNWLHKVLERLDKEYRLKGKPVSEPLIIQLLDEEFSSTMKGRVVESGMNLLLYDLAKRLMLDFQRQQSSLVGLEVIGSEQTLDTFLAVPIDTGETLSVRIAGKIDRIERFGDQIRIIDYKTGKVDLPSRTPENLAEKLLNDGQSDKMRQVWLYKYLALKNISLYGGLPRDNNRQVIYPAVGMPVEAGFYSFRDLKGGFRSNPVTFGRDETAAEYIAESENLLRTMVQKMISQAVSFQKTDNLETCKYCDYKKICGR